ncbi:MAG: hypothetical protein WAO08_04090 [Hyphomicrobiaceae bacterium]
MPNPDAALPKQAAASPPEYRRGVTEARMRFEVLAIFRGARCHIIGDSIAGNGSASSLDGGRETIPCWAPAAGYAVSNHMR